MRERVTERKKRLVERERGRKGEKEKGVRQRRCRVVRGRWREGEEREERGRKKGESGRKRENQVLPSAPLHSIIILSLSYSQSLSMPLSYFSLAASPFILPLSFSPPSPSPFHLLPSLLCCSPSFRQREMAPCHVSHVIRIFHSTSVSV